MTLSAKRLAKTDGFRLDNPGLVEVKQKWDRSGLDITDLLSTTAKDRSLGLAYNYGALLANNSFFLESLVSDFFSGDDGPILI